MNPLPDLAQEALAPDEWGWVHDLILDVERGEQGLAFIGKYGEWDLAVRQFRKVETRRITLGQPNERDWLWHAACLHGLLSKGKLLLLEATKLSERDLSLCNVTRKEIEAYVADLEQSLREAHHDFSESELAKAREKIFCAAA